MTERVPRPGELPQETAAREANAEAWEPLPGMVKLRCPQCRYWFAVAVEVAEAEEAPLCPDCAGRQR